MAAERHNVPFEYTDIREERGTLTLPSGVIVDTIRRIPLIKNNESPRQKIALIAHGYYETSDNLVPWTLGRELAAAGITTLAMSAYGFQDGRRERLRGFTIHDWAEDITAVANQLRKEGISQLYGAGHSLGGLALLMAAKKFDALALLDPSHGTAYTKFYETQDTSDMPRTGHFLINTSGSGSVDSMRHRDTTQGLGDTTHLAQEAQNLLIISAGEGILSSYGEQYTSAAPQPSRHVLLEGAGHRFSEGNALHMASDITASWFNQANQ